MYQRRKKSRQQRRPSAHNCCADTSSATEALPSIAINMHARPQMISSKHALFGDTAVAADTCSSQSTESFTIIDNAIASDTCSLQSKESSAFRHIALPIDAALSQSSQDSFFGDISRNPDTCSSQCSVESVEHDAQQWNYLDRDTSVYASCKAESVPQRPWKSPRKRCHSSNSVLENMQPLSESTISVRGPFNSQEASSVTEQHLLNHITERVFLTQGDKIQNSGKDPVNGQITRWNIFSHFPPVSEPALINEQVDVNTARQNDIYTDTEDKTLQQKSMRLDAELPDGVGNIQCSHKTSQTPVRLPRNLSKSTSCTSDVQKNEKLSLGRNRKHHKGRVVDLKADESGVLKKRYEVQKIVDHCTSKSNRYYYVKWKGWNHSDNTWEPEDHLKTCKDIFKSYIQFLKQRITTGNLFSTTEAKDLQEKLVSISKPELEKLTCQYVKSNNTVPYTVCSEEEIVYKMKSVFRSINMRSIDKNIEKVKHDILIRAYDIYRMVQVDELKSWEQEINSKATEKAKILVENNVDLECPPSNFTYINDYIPGEDVVIPDEPPIGCVCPKCDRLSKNCCALQFGSRYAYSHKRLLVVDVGIPIYECNKRCKCSQDCSNRVVQRGRKVDLSIFRTTTGCGWGVKTLQHIKKGCFICEYVGEVITTKEAERRGKIYDAEGRTYLFDLDFNVDPCPYTVDAALYGNVSHFINHSCNPNVAVYAVWINCLDPNLPKLGLFAKKDIKTGEELTFDYMHNNLGDLNSVTTQVPSSPRTRLELPNPGDSPNLSSSKIPCKCGAHQCKRYLF